jgi:hypothetical protein
MQQHYQQLHAAGRLPSASAATAAAVSCAAAGWSVPSAESMRHNLAQVQMHLQQAAQQQAQMQVQMSQAQLRGQMHAQMHAHFQAQQAGMQRAPACWSAVTSSAVTSSAVTSSAVTSVEAPPTGAPRAEAAPSLSSAQAPATAAPAPLPASLSEAGWSRPPEGALPPAATEQVRGIGTRAQSPDHSRSGSTGGESTGGESRGGGAVGEGLGEGSGEELGEGLGEAAGEEVSAQVSAILLMLIGHRTHHLARTHSPDTPPTRHAATSATISAISPTVSSISSPKDKQHAPCAAPGGQGPCDAGAAAEGNMLGSAGGAAEGAGGGGGGEAPGPMQAAMQAFGGGAPVYFPEAIDAPMEEVATPDSTLPPHHLTTLLLATDRLLRTFDD